MRTPPKTPASSPTPPSSTPSSPTLAPPRAARRTLARAAGASLLAFAAASLLIVGVPPINDVTTDAKMLPGHDGSADLLGELPPAAWLLQKEHYPKVAPLYLPLEPDRCFELVVSTMQSMPGIDVSQADASRRLLRGTATTPVLHFVDDIVLLVSEHRPAECRVDMRSRSRIGISDLGANAARITKVMAELTLRAAAVR